MSRIRSCGIAMPLKRLMCGEKTMSHGGGGNWSGCRPKAMNCMRVPDSSFTMPRVWFLPAGIFRNVNGFGIAVAERFKHFKLLEENIIQLAESDVAAGGDDWFHGINAENLLDGFVELLAEQLKILFCQRKARRHGMATETDQ